MAVITAAALGALLGAAMPQKRRSTGRLRATRSAKRTRSRRAMYTYRGRRGRKNWKARNRKIYALPRNFTTCKTTESVDPDNVVLNRNIIGVQALILINKGSAINQRLRDQCYLAGIKLNVHFTNLAANSVSQSVVNWAVVFPRNQSTLSNGTNDFFRDYTSNRSWDANDAGKTGLTWANAKINTDEFLVLARGRFPLSPRITTGGGTFNKYDNDKMIERYVKIARTITFDGPIEAVDQQCYFVTWIAQPDQGAAFDVSPGMNFRLRAICYFRDPKGA